MRHKQLFAALLLGVAVTTMGPVACNFAGTGSSQFVPGTELGIDPAAMDKTVKPGDDFFAFANGSWIRNTEIPADRSSIGGFLIADQKTEKQLEELISGISSGASADSDEGRVRDYYKAFLDTEWQANAFASALLMPASAIFALERRSGSLSPVDIAEHFRVSEEAAGYRLDLYTTREPRLP